MFLYTDFIWGSEEEIDSCTNLSGYLVLFLLKDESKHLKSTHQLRRLRYEGHAGSTAGRKLVPPVSFSACNMEMFDDGWLKAIDSCSAESNRFGQETVPLAVHSSTRCVYREVTEGFRDSDDPLMDIPEVWYVFWSRIRKFPLLYRTTIFPHNLQ